MAVAHTKRSAAFRERVDAAIHRIHLALWPDQMQLCQEVTDLLMNHTTDNGCMVKAKEDEPVFVLRGQDKFAPALLLAWGQLYDEEHAERENKPELAWNGTPRSKDAVECAETMAMYKTRKYPS